MGKLDRDSIPVAVKPPCKAAGLMLDAFDGDDLALIAEELAGPRTMAAVCQWIAPHLDDISDSAIKNHFAGRCSCADDVPLKGLRRG